MADQLSQTTAIFGLHLWVILGVSLGAAFVLLLFLVSLWFVSKRNKSKGRNSSVSKEIAEVRVDFSIPQRNQVQVESDSQPNPVTGLERQSLLLPLEEESLIGYHGIHVDIGRDHRISYPGSFSNGNGGGEMRGDRISGLIPEVSHLGWGHWYTLRELDVSTNGFSDENVIGEGGYGIVYRGILGDNTQVAIKNLLNNRGQAEMEFKVEVEAIGRVRHKNLVRLLGYCAEGAHRMLVYEYVNNGNLEQWLHEDVGLCSSLSWDIRMNIIIGTAKGLTYLHEGLDPKVIHRDIKSSNILLDKKWNPKVSDFGLAKLLEPDSNYITTRVMGTFGYVSPEYASTGMLNERSDVYSFGILIMETITGRKPIDYSRPAEEVNLVDWLKKMVVNGGAERVLDPKMPEKPALKALKQTLLVALRCVDRNGDRRPKMGHIVHILESEDFPFRDSDRRSGRLPGTSGLIIHQDIPKDETIHKRVTEIGLNDSAACIA